jgi:hypothetical protein
MRRQSIAPLTCRCRIDCRIKFGNDEREKAATPIFRYALPLSLATLAMNFIRESWMTGPALQLEAIHRLALCAILASFGAVLLSHAARAAPTPHESPRAYCGRVGTDDALREPPLSLAPAIRRLFSIRGPLAPKAAYYRCAEGAVKVCFVGANLHCGKANTSKNLPAVARWCETHPDTETIPLYVTGHDSLYSWHCIGSKAATGASHGALDARGFFEEYWKTVK